MHDLIPCFCPAPCRSRRNGVPQTCPSLQRIQGQAVVALAPWLSAYPGPHHNGKFITVMHQICHRSESLPATLQKAMVLKCLVALDQCFKCCIP